MRKGLIVLLCIYSGSMLAKPADPLCDGVNGKAFTEGDGSTQNPYLICNKPQLKSIATTPALLDKSFKMGADLNFDKGQYLIIGTKDNPFKGSLDGNGYKLLNIALPVTPTSTVVAPFGYVINGKVSNLTIKNLSFSSMPLYPVGGVIAHAENATLSNLTVKGLNMLAPDRSGGVVGELFSSLLTNSSANGVMTNHFGTDASGGLVGYANNSIINNCSSNVKITTLSTEIQGISAIGGIVGYSDNTTINNVYAQGDIDYSISQSYVRQVGGLIGFMRGGTLNFAYYAGRILINNAFSLGGAVGEIYGIVPSSGVFWDFQVAGVNGSAIGQGHPTSVLKTAGFWVQNLFDSTIWSIVDGAYPTLISQNKTK